MNAVCLGRADRLLDPIQHFFMLGKPADVVLAPDLFPVDMDVEDAARPLDQPGLDTECLINGFRQTGGRRLVVSFPAVFDGHFKGHRHLPLCRADPPHS